MFDHVETQRQRAKEPLSASAATAAKKTATTTTTLTSSTTTIARAKATLCGMLCFWHLAAVATSSPHFPRDSPIETGLKTEFQTKTLSQT